jgi:hypothetical protein
MYAPEEMRRKNRKAKKAARARKKSGPRRKAA